MRTKDPYQAETEEELRDVAFYWLQKSHMLQVEKAALLELLKSRGIEICVREMIEIMNRVQTKECQES